MASDDVFLGSSKRFQATIRKDGSAWDLTSATVTLILRRPNGGETEYTATPTSPATAGIAEYEAAKTIFMFGGAGEWERIWRTVEGTVEQVYGPIKFLVKRV